MVKKLASYVFSSAKSYRGRIGIFSLLLVGVFLFSSYQNRNLELYEESKSYSQLEQGGEQVLGRQTPYIYLSGGRNNYGSGGLIALASTDEPEIDIRGYDVSGTFKVSVYEADEQAILDYLTYDEEGNQVYPQVNSERFRFITSLDYEMMSSYGERGSLVLPLEKSGIYYLKLEQGDLTVDSYVVRSNIGTIVKEGDNQYIFWSQNYETRRSMTEGSLSLYNLKDNLKDIGSASLDGQGLAVTNLDPEADIAIVRNAGQIAVVPINLRYLNTSYNYRAFQRKEIDKKSFVFTDRPIYKPGDTVYFKSIMRDDDDARYSIPTGEVRVELKGWQDSGPIFERTYSLSSVGAIDGEIELPEYLKPGGYSLNIKINGETHGYGGIDVEYYRKPEYYIELFSQEKEIVAGDEYEVTVTGNYFSGQPLANQNVNYTIRESNLYEISYLSEKSYYLNSNYYYGYVYGEQVDTGKVTLDENGVAKIKIDSNKNDDGKNKVYVVEISYTDETGNPAYDRKNVLVWAGDYDIYRNDRGYYSSKVGEEFEMPIKLVSHRGGDVSNRKIVAKIRREEWVSYTDASSKYPQYRKIEENLESIDVTTNTQGEAIIKYVPAKVGLYYFDLESEDQKGNKIKKTFYRRVTSSDSVSYFGQYDNEISVTPDKQRYLPGDTAVLTITSSTEDRDVFLTLERAKVNRYQVVSINGVSSDVEVPLVDTDMPNIFAKANSFSLTDYDSGSANLIVSPESKKLMVKVNPDGSKYGPGDDVSVEIETTDINGNPISAEVAVWAIDKALLELKSESDLNIFDFFWEERYNNTQTSHSLEGIRVYDAERGGGCFVGDTTVLMSDGSFKNIKDIKVGDYVLTRESENSSKLTAAKVTNTHEARVGSYLIINRDLKVTTNHRLWVNESWTNAGSVQVGDVFVDKDGMPVVVESVEWMMDEELVYNLTVEDYHTYFADGIWVHNQKGGPRSEFKDTAYWNPSVRTDSNGKAQVRFKLPDNLTTWVISAVGATQDTIVGDAKSEVLVTKDVVIRPVIPNILREGDELVVSSYINNHTDYEDVFDVDLFFDSGRVDEATKSGITVSEKGIERVSWAINPDLINESAKMQFSVRSRTNEESEDSVIQEIPVKAFGFMNTNSKSGYDNASFDVSISKKINTDLSSVKLSLSSSLLGTLPSAMEYLVDYPYGCMEQTTSRFVPAVIAQANSGLFSNALEDKDIDGIIEKGINRLSAQQSNDGGWAWWRSGDSDPYLTAYVIEFILKAESLGYEVENQVLSSAKKYLENPKMYGNDESGSLVDLDKSTKVAKNYALALFREYGKMHEVSDTEGMSADLLAMHVMSSYLAGDKNPATNGLNQLISLSEKRGDGVYWKAGDKTRFGSEDASTAMAVKAILLAEGDRDLAVSGVRHLTRVRNRNYWSNTYATARVIDAVVELSKTGDEQNPNYSYEVFLDGSLIKNGYVSSSDGVIENVEIPIEDISESGSIVEVKKNGQGQLYSTIVVNEHINDKNAEAVDNGLWVTREYVNEKGPEYTLAVGDVAEVRITVGGLESHDYYGVIVDELPSGMIPINNTFKNEQYGRGSRDYYFNSYGVTDADITESGVVLSLYRVTKGERTYTYKARVISEGKFLVPPVTASLMYNPEVNGRSEVQAVEIGRESKYNPLKAKISENDRALYIGILIGMGVVFLVGSVIVLVVMKKRGYTMEMIKMKIVERFGGLRGRFRRVPKREDSDL